MRATEEKKEEERRKKNEEMRRIYEEELQQFFANKKKERRSTEENKQRANDDYGYPRTHYWINEWLTTFIIKRRWELVVQTNSILDNRAMWVSDRALIGHSGGLSKRSHLMTQISNSCKKFKMCIRIHMGGFSWWLILELWLWSSNAFSTSLRNSVKTQIESDLRFKTYQGKR